jgi:hypothetical protein
VTLNDDRKQKLVRLLYLMVVHDDYDLDDLKEEFPKEYWPNMKTGQISVQ